MSNQKILNILETLRSGNLQIVYDYKEYLNLTAIELYSKPKLNESEVEDLKNIIFICNITYNDTDKELLPIEDGIYDLLLEKYRKYDPNFQIGAELINFDPTNFHSNTPHREFVDAVTFMDPITKKDIFFLDDIVIDPTKYIDRRDFEIKNTPLSEEYITKRYHDTESNHPELIGTLDKAKFVLNKDAITRGVFNDNNVKTVERDFFGLHLTKGIINPSDQFDMILELKYDGISIEADCTDEIVSARSRGDTGVGKVSDFTPFLKGYKFPHRAPGSPMIGVKFEAIITQNDLVYFNAAKNQNYKNCRSAIVGLLSSSDAYKYRDFITLVPLAVEEKVYREVCHSDRIEEIKFLNENFISKGCPLRHSLVGGTYIENLAWINIFTQNAESMRYMIPFMYDGVVVSYRDEAIRQKLGRENYINKFSIAVKFNPLKKESIFRGYTYTVGQDGSITPMIHYDPVEFYGTIHPKSSGHSYARFKELQLHYGDIISIEYVNDVMPYVSKPINDFNLDNEKNTPLEPFPTNCPVCGQLLMLSDSGKSMKCINPNCGGRQLSRMVNMFSKLNMDGFGEATVAKLGCYHLKELGELLTKPDSMEVLVSKGFGEIESTNIINEFRKILYNPLPESILLGAIGFTGISTKTWELILPKVNYQKLRELFNMLDINKVYYNTAIEYMSSIKGIGPSTADTIGREFKFFQDDIDWMFTNGNIVPYIPKVGKKIRFTGFRDAEFVKELNSMGFNADDNASLTKDTDILLVPDESHSSSKTKKAKIYGTMIIPVNEFRNNIDKYL